MTIDITQEEYWSLQNLAVLSYHVCTDEGKQALSEKASELSRILARAIDQEKMTATQVMQAQDRQHFDSIATLRDEFAKSAMIGLLANPSVEGSDDVAEWSYKLADAMLKARSA